MSLSAPQTHIWHRNSTIGKWNRDFDFEISETGNELLIDGEWVPISPNGFASSYDEMTGRQRNDLNWLYGNVYAIPDELKYLEYPINFFAIDVPISSKFFHDNIAVIDFPPGAFGDENYRRDPYAATMEHTPLEEIKVPARNNRAIMIAAVGLGLLLLRGGNEK